jgi:KamA family protein
MTLWKDNLMHFKKNLKAIDEIGLKDVETLNKITERHPMLIPSYYYDLIDPNDSEDPIKLLSVPNVFEADLMGDYDTSGEQQNTKLPGLQHKYENTALVLTTSACFMYCRHCFRKRMVGYTNDEVNTRIEETINYLKENKVINNVLLSGGDSFCLSNDQIEKYLIGLSEIDHLDFIRFGTRSPVVFPERIYSDDNLLEILKTYNKKKRILVVSQFNHPRELTKEAKKAVDALMSVGITVHNQTVLLKGVNDNPEVLSKLLKSLNEMGVNPYYVFQCRPVKAVKKGFQLPLVEAYKIISEARKKMDGLSKRFRFIMSHPKGKIEIIGRYNDEMIFKFHQSKDPCNHDQIFVRTVNSEHQWLDLDLNPTL